MLLSSIVDDRARVISTAKARERALQGRRCNCHEFLRFAKSKVILNKGMLGNDKK